MAPATAVSFDPRAAAGCGSGRMIDLEGIHDFAVAVAMRAGALLRRSTRQSAPLTRVGTSSKVQMKSSEVDLVTDMDVQVEELIRKEIQLRWPDDDIVAEESEGKRAGAKAKWHRGKGPTWHVDPLDGTLNYAHSLQLHCISIGFSCSHETLGVESLDDALVGVIYAPMLGSHGMLWSGARGHGAYLSYPTNAKADASHGCSLAALKASAQLTSVEEEVDGEMQPLPVQRLPLVEKELPPNAPSGVLYASEWGKDRQTGRDESGQKGNLSHKLATFANLAAKDAFRDAEEVQGEPPRYLHGVRSLGSTALDLAFLAQGSIDVLWEGGCWEWDVCAGVALLLETGGMLTDSNPPQSRSSAYWATGKRLPRAQLGARRFLGVRACIASNHLGESPVESQERVVREIWKRSEGLNYRRDGVHYDVETEKDDESRSKASSSVRSWSDPLRERKRLTREEAHAQALQVNGGGEEADGTFGGRLLDEGKDQWSHNAWDHVEPPASYLSLIEDKLRVQEQTKLSNDEAAKFHDVPALYWDSFYKSHENRFFKDRKWLHLEFPELIKASLADAPHTRILEVGCGAGNTVFPLLEINQNRHLEIFACDYSSEAVNVVKSNPLYAEPTCGTCRASVWDLTSASPDGSPSIPSDIAPHSLDIVVLIFVLSALHPNEWQRAVANVRHLLKTDGIVLVRDYGRHDLPQVRFGKGRMIEDNFYVRGDGTRVYFFTPEDFLSMFHASPPSSEPVATSAEWGEARECEFETLQLAIDRRMILNRKEKKQMFRHWLQAKFRYLGSP